MDFFQQQDRARRNSFWMILFFIISVVAVVVAVDMVFYVAFYEDLWNPKTVEAHRNAVQTMIFAAVGTVLVIVIGTIYRCIQLRTGGGRSVAEQMGARLVDPNTTDLQERRYLNIVEEMAIASGVPVPPAYIMDTEPSINAFAAGNSPEDAVVAVTRGTLETLNRDELQGVIGHEFSHILNGDMRTHIRLLGITHGILLIYLIGYGIFRMMTYMPVVVSSSSDDDENSSNSGSVRLVLILVSLWVMLVGCVGLFLSNLIKSALSRQREYLADASSVQFTRNPKGIANALKKIGGMDPEKQVMQSQAAAEANHFFFTESTMSFFQRLFASHPPLQERIRRLDPEFNPALAQELTRLAEENASGNTGYARFAAVGNVKKSVSSPVQVQNLAPKVNISPNSQELRQKMVSVYHAEERSLADMLRDAEKTEKQRKNAPQNAKKIQTTPKKPSKSVSDTRTLREMIGNTLGASAYVLALLTDTRKEEIYGAQKKIVQNVLNGILLPDYEWWLKRVPYMSAPKQLMNLQLAIPTLKQLSPQQYTTIRTAIRSLIDADHVVDLNEFVIYSMVCRQLDVVFGLRRPSTGNGVMDLSMFRAATVVFSRLAYAGSTDINIQRKAFRRGIQELGVADADLLQPPMCENPLLQNALARLDTLDMDWKRHFLHACESVIMYDHVETDGEAVLYYGISATLGIYN